MTNKEAIENLRYLISEDCTDTQHDYIEEIQMAIAALEKQEGKKPQEVRKEIDRLVENSPAHRKILFCPNCGTQIKIESWTMKRCFGAGTILSDNRSPKYCPDCGQHIDWTEGE